MQMGIRYVVVAIGTPMEPADDEDCVAIKALLESSFPDMMVFTVLSERVSNKLTLALAQEMGAL